MNENVCIHANDNISLPVLSQFKWIPEHNTWELRKGKTQKNRNCCRKPLQRRCDMEHHSEDCMGTNNEVYNSPEVRKLIWSLSWNPTNQKRTGNQPRSNQSSPESGVKESSSNFSKTSQPQISPYVGVGSNPHSLYHTKYLRSQGRGQKFLLFPMYSIGAREKKECHFSLKGWNPN